jgi:cell filamentation protein
VSKYQFTESDIYLPGTDIPKNRLGIATHDLLHEVEETLLQQAYKQFINELDASICFDQNYFKSLHQTMFKCVQSADNNKLLEIISNGLHRN